MFDRFGIVVSSRLKLPNKNITSGAVSSIEQDSPEEVKLKIVRRKVLCNSSFTMSDSDEEEQQICSIPRNRLAADGEFLYNCSCRPSLSVP